MCAAVPVSSLRRWARCRVPSSFRRPSPVSANHCHRVPRSGYPPAPARRDPRSGSCDPAHRAPGTTLDRVTGTVQSPPLTVLRPGLVDYQLAWDDQRTLHEAVAQGRRPATVLLLEHPDVYTAGKRTEFWERPMDGTPVAAA